MATTIQFEGDEERHWIPSRDDIVRWEDAELCWRGVVTEQIITSTKWDNCPIWSGSSIDVDRSAFKYGDTSDSSSNTFFCLVQLRQPLQKLAYWIKKNARAEYGEKRKEQIQIDFDGPIKTLLFTSVYSVFPGSFRQHLITIIHSEKSLRTFSQYTREVGETLYRKKSLL